MLISHRVLQRVVPISAMGGGMLRGGPQPIRPAAPAMRAKNRSPARLQKSVPQPSVKEILDEGKKVGTFILIEHFI